MMDGKSFVLNKIRHPMFNVSYEDLAKMPGVTYKGQLRRKRSIHNFAEKINLGLLVSSFIRWEQCHVVLHNGCLYIFGNSKQKKPDKAFSLFGYTQVLRAGEVRLRDVAWPFKVVFVLDTDAKVHYFGADCEDELKKWMFNIRNEMLLANDIKFSGDSDSMSLDGDDYSDLETPVSTRNYFRSIRNLDDIQRSLGHDPDLEDYVYAPHEDYDDSFVSSQTITGAACQDAEYVIDPDQEQPENMDTDDDAGNSRTTSHHVPVCDRPLPPVPGGVLPPTPPGRQRLHQPASPNIPPVALPKHPAASRPRLNPPADNSRQQPDSPVDKCQPAAQHRAGAPAADSRQPTRPPVGPPALPTADSSGNSRPVARPRQDPPPVPAGNGWNVPGGRPAVKQKPDVKPKPSKVLQSETDQQGSVSPSTEATNGHNNNEHDTKKCWTNTAPSASHQDLSECYDNNMLPPTKSQNCPGPLAKPRPPKRFKLPDNPAADSASHVVQDNFITKPLPLPPPTRSKPNCPVATPGPKRPLAKSEDPMSLEDAAMWVGDPGEGNRIMMGIEEEGSYMLRMSGDSDNKTLLVVAEFQLRKYKIHVNQDAKYSLQSNFTYKFESISQLLCFYATNNLPNRQTKLTRPYTEFVDVTSGQISPSFAPLSPVCH